MRTIFFLGYDDETRETLFRVTVGCEKPQIKSVVDFITIC